MIRPKITNDQVRAMRAARNGGATYRELMTAFGMSWEGVRKIVKGLRRKKVD